MAIGCDPTIKKAVVRLCDIKKLDASKANLSYLCSDMTQAGQLIGQIGKEVYKIIHRNTPGPVTFILPASKDVPHHFKNKKRTIGIRIPDDYFLKALLTAFGRPLVSTSLPTSTEEELMYPDELVELYKHQIDMWIDDERAQSAASMIVDCNEWPPVVLRDTGHDLVL